MTETRHNTTEPRLGAARGQRGGFPKGLVGGVLIGTAAGVLFAPQIYAALRPLRRRLTDAAADASAAAAETFRGATTRVGDAADDLQEKARGVYGQALNVVVRGAEDVKQRATKAQTSLDQSAAHAGPRSS